MDNKKLVKIEYKESDDLDIVERIKDSTSLDRDDYFYLPGKILHIDSDEKYLNKCLKLYEQLSLPAYGVYMNEKDIKTYILDLINKESIKQIVISIQDSKIYACFV